MLLETKKRFNTYDWCNMMINRGKKSPQKISPKKNIHGKKFKYYVNITFNC